MLMKFRRRDRMAFINSAFQDMTKRAPCRLIGAPIERHTRITTSRDAQKLRQHQKANATAS